MDNIDNKLKPFINELNEKNLILRWLIKGHNRIGLPIKAVKVLTKEWVVKHYNVELSYFNQE